MANWLIEILTDIQSSDGKTRIAKGITKTISGSMLGNSKHMDPRGTNIGRDAISKITGIAKNTLNTSTFKITKIK